MHQFRDGEINHQPGPAAGVAPEGQLQGLNLERGRGGTGPCSPHLGPTCSFPGMSPRVKFSALQAGTYLLSSSHTASSHSLLCTILFILQMRKWLESGFEPGSVKTYFLNYPVFWIILCPRNAVYSPHSRPSLYYRPKYSHYLFPQNGSG